MRLASVSVDLDGISHYEHIHGLSPLSTNAKAAHAVYDRALSRMQRFADEHSFPLTLFAIGSDLERPENAAYLRDLVAQGHAVENHSYAHRYDLTRLSSNEIRDDIEKAQHAIERATGVRPTGFRAPGYTITDEVFDVLEALSFRFDSSVFPCPPYYAAKALVMGSMQLFGRQSASILDTPRVLTAPTRPYRPGKPFASKGHRALIELPIQVVPGLRLPLIGTSLALAGRTLSRLLTRACLREPFINLELHGIDFLDCTDDLEHLVPYQHELKIPLATRLDALASCIQLLQAKGFSFVRLDEAARSVEANAL